MEDGSDLSFALSYWHTARCSRLQRRRDGMGRKVGFGVTIHAWVMKNVFSGYNRDKNRFSYRLDQFNPRVTEHEMKHNLLTTDSR